MPLPVLIAALAMTVTPVTPRNPAPAEDFIRLAHVAETFEAMAKQGEAELAASVDDAPCDAIKPILRERNAEIARDSRAYLTSKSLHDRTVKLLQETYSDAELAQVNEALNSPGGRLLAEKSPRLNMKLLDLMHEGDTDAERKSQALDAKYRQRFESVRRQCEAQMPHDRGGDERDDEGADDREDNRRDDDRRR